MDIKAPMYSLASFLRGLLGIDYAKTIIDISKWQCTQDDSRLFDFDVYETSDGIFVIVKASQGTVADVRFSYYVTELTKRDEPFGAYHFGDTRYPSRVSAKYFAEQCNELESQKPKGIKSGKLITKYWLDVERYGFGWRSTPAKVYNRTWIREFLDEFRKHTDVKIGIYTSKSHWEEYVEPMEEIHELDLWIANYYTSYPKIPTDWSNYKKSWLLWQFCASCTGCASCGKIYGAASVSIDSNKFNGTMKQFNDWLIDKGEEELSSQEYLELKSMIENNETDIESNTSRIEVLEGTSIFFKEMRCTANPSLRIRTAPETGEVIGSIPYNDIVLISSNRVADSQGRGDWIYCNYAGTIGWCAGWYLVPV
jgi:GH25 family lysozyme M1 (1,4-beta-N-acetylmuramidase)